MSEVSRDHPRQAREERPTTWRSLQLLLLPEQATDKPRNGYIPVTIHGFIRATCPA